MDQVKWTEMVQFSPKISRNSQKTIYLEIVITIFIVNAHVFDIGKKPSVSCNPVFMKKPVYMHKLPYELITETFISKYILRIKWIAQKGFFLFFMWTCAQRTISTCLVHDVDKSGSSSIRMIKRSIFNHILYSMHGNIRSNYIKLTTFRTESTWHNNYELFVSAIYDII